jgi:hypothetical protein
MNNSSLEEPTPKLLSDLKQSEEDEKARNVIYFNTGKDALRYLDDEIKFKKKKS